MEMTEAKLNNLKVRAERLASFLHGGKVESEEVGFGARQEFVAIIDEVEFWLANPDHLTTSRLKALRKETGKEHPVSAENFPKLASQLHGLLEQIEPSNGRGSLQQKEPSNGRDPRWPSLLRGQPKDPPDPSDAALFAAATDRLFGSWGFKLALGMFVVAAGFAIFGTISIDGQSRSIKAELRDRYTEVQTTLLAQRTGFENWLTGERESAKVALDEAKGKLEETSKRLEGAEEREKEFRETAVEKVKAQLRQDLEVYWQQILAKLEQDRRTMLAAQQAEREKFVAKLKETVEVPIDTLAGNVSLAEKRMKAAAEGIDKIVDDTKVTQKELDELQVSIGNMVRTSQDAGRKLELVGATAKEAGDLDERVNHQLQQSTQLQTNLEGYLKAAENAKDSLDERRKSIEKNFVDLQVLVGTQKNKLDGLVPSINAISDAIPIEGERLRKLKDELNGDDESQRKVTKQLDEAVSGADDLVERTSNAQRRVRDLEASMGYAEGEARARRQQIGRIVRILDTIERDAQVLSADQTGPKEQFRTLYERVAKLEAIESAKSVPNAVPAPQRRTEIGLSPEDRRQIQQGLMDRHLMVACRTCPTGVFGQLTRGAIRTYQAKRGETATGVLTSEQIDDLLGAPTAAPTAAKVGIKAANNGVRIR